MSIPKKITILPNNAQRVLKSFKKRSGVARVRCARTDVLVWAVVGRHFGAFPRRGRSTSADPTPGAFALSAEFVSARVRKQSTPSFSMPVILH
jgi:hypothetical protein